METFAPGEVTCAVAEALRLGAISFDIVRHLLLGGELDRDHQGHEQDLAVSLAPGCTQSFPVPVWPRRSIRSTPDKPQP